MEKFLKNNLVSVCITTYNRQEQLPLTLKSVLKQTYKNLEIIIVDDYSNDGTKDLIKNKLLKLDKRIKYIRHKKNRGLAEARNTAINNAKGKYFAFCDDDDLWDSKFVKEFLKVASNYNRYWCFCCSEKKKYFSNKKIQINFEFEGSLKKFIKKGYTPPVAAQFYNLSILKDIRGYNKKIKVGIDHDLWIRLAKADIKIKYIPKALSIPNSNHKQKRITTNYSQRMSGIKDALKIWKKDLILMYGKKFYTKFYNAYLYREQQKFIKISLKTFNISQIYKILKNFSITSFLNIVFFYLIKITFKKFIFKIFSEKKNIENIKPTLIIKN